MIKPENNWAVKANFCKCGCGELVTRGYKRGHYWRGKTKPVEWGRKISAIKREKGVYIECSYCHALIYRKNPNEWENNFCDENCYYKWQVGRKMPADVVEKMRLSRIGVSCNEETKRKIGDANRGENNGQFNKKCTEEQKLASSIRSKALHQNPSYKDKLRAYYKTDEAKIKFRAGALKAAESLNNKHKSNTKPELEMREILRNIGVDFIHSYRVTDIEHAYVADFYIPSIKLIIEVDGTYWHQYPYGRRLDIARMFELPMAGYKIYRYWENELDIDMIRKDIDNVHKEQLITEAIERAKIIV